MHRIRCSARNHARDRRRCYALRVGDLRAYSHSVMRRRCRFAQAVAKLHAMHGGWSEAVSALSPRLSAQGLRSRAGDGPPVSGAACCPADELATLQLDQLVQDRPAFPRSEARADQQIELPGITQARPSRTRASKARNLASKEPGQPSRTRRLCPACPGCRAACDASSLDSVMSSS